MPNHLCGLIYILLWRAECCCFYAVLLHKLIVLHLHSALDGRAFAGYRLLPVKVTFIGFSYVIFCYSAVYITGIQPSWSNESLSSFPHIMCLTWAAIATPTLRHLNKKTSQNLTEMMSEVTEVLCRNGRGGATYRPICRTACQKRGANGRVKVSSVINLHLKFKH